VWSLVTTSAERVRPAARQGDDDGNDVGGSRLATSLSFAGARAACAAAAAGLAAMTILVVIGWIAAPHPRFGLIGVARTASVLWLVGHHVAVQVKGAGRIGMLPLGLVLLPGAMLWCAGRSVARGKDVTGPRQVTSAALAVAVPYAVIAGVLAVLSRSALATASFTQAVFAGFAVAFVAAWFGAARAVTSWRKLGTLMSSRSKSILVGAAGSLAVLGAAGMLTTAVALANHERQFAAVYGLLGPGLVGAGLLLLAQLAYLPNAVLWAIAYMLGPGFAVGTGTVVAPTGSVLGPMPAFPLLAALPTGAHGSGPGLLVGTMLAIPYLAGVVGGLLVVRLVPQVTIDGAAIRGFCGGALSGIVLGLLAAFAGGPLGEARLSAVGPSAWQVAAVGALELGISAAVSAGAARWWSGRRRWPDRPAEDVDPRPVSQTSRAREDGGHVIFIDQWAAEQESPKRPRGPSSLP
jgi:hypothetical protein